MGKLIEQSRGEVKICAAIAQYYADNAKAFLKPVKYPSSLGDAWVEHHPIGIIMAVEPWNFPFYQLMRVLAPNMAVGNSVMVKHASIVPTAQKPSNGWSLRLVPLKVPIPICSSLRIKLPALSMTIVSAALRLPVPNKRVAWWLHRRPRTLKIHHGTWWE